jgi:signal peptidase II
VTLASRSGASATGPDAVTGHGAAGEVIADDGADEVEIVEDEGVPEADGAAATEAPDAWRGPSIGRWIAFAAIAIGVLVVDQASKAWVTGTLDVGEGIELIGEWLRVVHWRNSGALFGLLPQSAPIFAVVSLGVVALIVLYHRRAGRGYLTTVALALLLGGAIGNLLDRLRFGSVVDFVDMGIGQWRFYTYNAADAAITTAILLLIAMAIVPRLADWGAGGAIDD